MGRRVITATVGLPLLTVIVWAGLPWLSVLAAVLAAIGAIELCRLARGWGGRPIGELSGFWAAVLVAGGHLLTTEVATQTIWVVVASALLLGVLAWPIWRSRSGAGLKDLGLTAAAAAYMGVFLAYGPVLRASDDGGEWVFVAVFGTFATDTSAFLVGGAIGKRPLAPSISPGKTWEGAVAGVVAAVAATAAMSSVFSLSVSVAEAAALGVALGVLAQLGDLAVSRIKRLANAKDSGALIPGHGGLLDRLDSIVFNLALVYHFSQWAVR